MYSLCNIINLPKTLLLRRLDEAQWPVQRPEQSPETKKPDDTHQVENDEAGQLAQLIGPNPYPRGPKLAWAGDLTWLLDSYSYLQFHSCGDSTGFTPVSPFGSA
jgi:hypothetical protein